MILFDKSLFSNYDKNFYMGLNVDTNAEQRPRNV